MEHEKRSEHAWSKLRKIIATPGPLVAGRHQRCLGSTALANNEPSELYSAAPDNLLEKPSIYPNAMQLEPIYWYVYDPGSLLLYLYMYIHVLLRYVFVIY